MIKIFTKSIDTDFIFMYSKDNSMICRGDNHGKNDC